jgi:galactosyl transferase GMA12/MNN10 family
MKIVFLHKSFADKEHLELNKILDGPIIKNKQDYCNLHGYEFINDISPNMNKHWNEDYWAHIPVIVNLMEARPDVDLVFFNRVNGIITDMENHSRILLLILIRIKR